MNAQAGSTREVTWNSGETGLLATAQVQVVDNQGAVVLGPVSPDRELGTTGEYVKDLSIPATLGDYSIQWSPDGTFDAETIATEDLVVISGDPAETVPLPPLAEAAGPTVGPCSAWTSVEAVDACCATEVGSNLDLYEDSIIAASQVLSRLSAGQFSGICERTVRAGSDVPCGLQVLARGYVIGWESWRTQEAKVLLPNYPVTEIVEVMIDGVALAESEYRLDGWRWLTRMADVDGNRQFWPAWGRLDREATEEDTFQIRYLHGTAPPLIGQQAAAQLACEIYKSCPGNEGVAECKLPKNATRVTRQGITIEMNALYFDKTKKHWATGMNLVDLFLNAYTPNGLKRPPMIWSPDPPQFAVEVGTVMGS